MIAVVIPSKTVTNAYASVKAVQDLDPGCNVRVIWDAHAATVPTTIHSASLISVHSPFNFSRNVNIGIRSLRSEEEGVILLNDDAILKTIKGFSLLAEAARLFPEYGVISATTNVVGNWNQRPSGIGLREEPRMVCFVCVYIPRTTIDVVGLLDENIGIGGFEDDDYSLRVRRAGLKIGIHDGCFVDHGSLPSSFRVLGGPGYDPHAAENFRKKWGADNHAL